MSRRPPRVLALTDSTNPWHSFWIRFGQYIPDLEAEVEICTELPPAAALAAFDCLLLYRFNSAWGDLATPLADARRQGLLLLADLDDFLWQAPSWDKPRLKAFTAALRQCQRISCSTPALQEVLQLMFPRQQVMLLANSAPKPPGLMASWARAASAKPLRIGWTGAPWTRPQDLALIKPLAAWIKQRVGALQLVHIGHAEGRLSLAEALGLPPALVLTKPLMPYANYLEAINFDIGLAPLAPGTFNEFKSELKLLEYSGRGIPWIASDAPPYRQLCEQWSWGGRLCREPHQWIDQLQALLDPGQRLAEGQQLQQLSQAHQSYGAAVERWSRAISNSWA